MRSRDLIIRATLELVERGGFGAVNVSAVAALAGVSRQTVYSHFASREEMVSQAVQSVAQTVLADLSQRLSATESTVDYVVELIICARRAVRDQPVLAALARSDRGNPLFDEGMMERAHPIASHILAPLIERDPVLRDSEAFDALVELVARLGLSLVLFDSAATADDGALRRRLRGWLQPGRRPAL